MASAHEERRAEPKYFTDGTLLQNLAQQHVNSFRELFGGRRDFAPSREITLGSACTGSASEVAAAFYFEQAVNKVSD